MAILSQYVLRHPMPLSLKGKVLLAEGHLFGKSSAMACNLLAEILKEGISQQGGVLLRIKISNLCAALSGAKPRILQRQAESRPVLIFAVGACEDRTTDGGVAIFHDKSLDMFGAVITDNRLAPWSTYEDQSQVN